MALRDGSRRRKALVAFCEKQKSGHRVPAAATPNGPEARSLRRRACFELRNRKDAGKRAIVVWLWFGRPHYESSAAHADPERPHQSRSCQWAWSGSDVKKRKAAARVSGEFRIPRWAV